MILRLMQTTGRVSWRSHRHPCTCTFAVIVSFLQYAQSFKYLNKVKYAGFPKDFKAKHKEWQKSAKAMFTCSAGMANAFSEFALLLKSVSLPFPASHLLSKHSEDLFLIRIHTRNHVAQQAPAAPDSIKCLIQFYNMVFI